ncbi:hypothetical protein ILUMI_18815 [Ignelater luminosus]|uniref:Zinc finger PHD-type domain-containing protein n=1 Tax=Ignelater luminosus TaxID=2038154 RepID=A0A8K0CJ81_IGNLU|nr:hypothetical protein ILUMI_18815 [Ignelater luminosus]
MVSNRLSRMNTSKPVAKIILNYMVVLVMTEDWLTLCTRFRAVMILLLSKYDNADVISSKRLLLPDEDDNCADILFKEKNEFTEYEDTEFPVSGQVMDSPFYVFFQKVYTDVFDNYYLVPESNQHTCNPYVHIAFAKYLLKHYMPYVPLWSALMSKLKPVASNTIRYSNSNAESWFKIVKHDVLNEKKNLKAGRFIDIVKLPKKDKSLRQAKVVEISPEREYTQKSSKDEHMEIDNMESKETWRRRGKKKVRSTYFSSTPVAIKNLFTAAEKVSFGNRASAASTTEDNDSGMPSKEKIPRIDEKATTTSCGKSTCVDERKLINANPSAGTNDEVLIARIKRFIIRRDRTQIQNKLNANPSTVFTTRLSRCMGTILVCGQHDIGSNWILCKLCRRWVHFSCLKITAEEEQRMSVDSFEFVCLMCNCITPWQRYYTTNVDLDDIETQMFITSYKQQLIDIWLRKDTYLAERFTKLKPELRKEHLKWHYVSESFTYTTVRSISLYLKLLIPECDDAMFRCYVLLPSICESIFYKVSGYKLCETDLATLHKEHYERTPSEEMVLPGLQSSIQSVDTSGSEYAGETNDCQNVFLCQDPFKESDFVNETKHRLNYMTIPIRVDTVNHEPQANAKEFTSLSHLPHKEILSSSQCLDEFDFLLECKGILRQIGVKRKDLHSREEAMYQIHRNTMGKMSKLKKALENEKENYLIRNQMQIKVFMAEDKSFALSIYKRGPRTYRYLQEFFALPSIRTMKDMLSKIPFETGINSLVLAHISSEIEKMEPLNRYISLSFDEMYLSSGVYYDPFQDQITGYEDLGHLGRKKLQANHTLVFMIRGLRRSYKQVVNYYLTNNCVGAAELKSIIIETIPQLHKIGFKVVCTVCDQRATNRSALKALSEQTRSDCDYQFFVNGGIVSIIYDVSHLLKNTSNVLIRCKLLFANNKCAKMENIEGAFHHDQRTRTYKILKKLHQEHFNFQDSYNKMKVGVAAKQLSESMVLAIETFQSVGLMSDESLFIAEFCHQMDELFDSLNGSSATTSEVKKYRCALSSNSIDLKTNKAVTNEYYFIKGWTTTIKSMIYIWQTLSRNGFKYLAPRAFNQDRVENLFSQIRQHGKSNINPTCHHFIATLKTVIVNALGKQFIRGSNCEDDGCTPITGLAHLLHNSYDSKPNADDETNN